jgi:cyclic pyranopterin phosphate synthase
VVFEGADLAQLERTKHGMPEVIQELIFHPDAQLASTWQPWDGIIGPPAYGLAACSQDRHP